ncbi:hypothetical protein ACQ4PT_032125 [Festuca glaucescens]
MATYPHNWELLTSDLVRVDSRRFCIARLFEVYDDEYQFLTKENFAVFTGVELERNDTAEDGIQVIKHKSIRYNFDRTLLQLHYLDSFWQMFKTTLIPFPVA